MVGLKEFFRFNKNEEKIKELEQKLDNANAVANEAVAQASAYPMIPGSGYVLPYYRFTMYNGEKNDGALGPILNVVPDYYGLAQRSWQSYITSDIAKTIIDKWITWIISSGLKLKANPVKLVLESEGIKLENTERFNDIVEARFSVWANSVNSSYSGEKNLKQIAKECYLNAKIGGDVLVVLRYEKGTVNVQLLDGRRLMTPGVGMIGDTNIISNGVEMDSRGRHVNYWLRDTDGVSRNIPAYSKTGMRTAFLVKGSKWTLDYHRGLPVIAVVMESIGKLERYKEAVVANAEEIANIVMQIVHGAKSDGGNPFSAKSVTNRWQSPNAAQTTPVDDFNEQLAKRVEASYNKRVINMSNDSRLEPVQPGTSIREFQPFYETNSHIICAAVGIPPNVAFSLYTDSFSASRAATKDWDHTIDVERDDFTDQFYMHIYKFWLFMEVINNKVDAPGFLTAFIKGNFMVTESYTNARFTGPHFPHIDPLKEVNAERAKLGDLAKNVPLTTIEQATENLSGGDSDSNMEQFAEEIEQFESFGLNKEMQPTENEQTEK